MTDLELGLDTFGDVTVDARRERRCRTRRSSATSSTQAVLADQLGLDFIGVGEHHRADFAVSAPDVVLAAIAGTHRAASASARPSRCSARTTRSGSSSGSRRSTRSRTGAPRSSSAAARSPSRSRSSASTSHDYEELFEEKLELFAELLEETPVTWRGTTARAAHEPDGLPADRVGHAEDVDRRRRHAAVGRPRRALRPAADARDHRRRPARASRPTSTCTTARSREFGQAAQPIGVHSPGYVAETDEQANEELWPHYEAMHDRIGRERGWPPMSRGAVRARGRARRRALRRLAGDRRDEDRGDGAASACPAST